MMSNLQLSTEASLHTQLPGIEPCPEGLQAHQSLNTKKGAGGGEDALCSVSWAEVLLTPLKMPSSPQEPLAQTDQVHPTAG